MCGHCSSGSWPKASLPSKQKGLLLKTCTTGLPCNPLTAISRTFSGPNSKWQIQGCGVDLSESIVRAVLTLIGGKVTLSSSQRTEQC